MTVLSCKHVFELSKQFTANARIPQVILWPNFNVDSAKLRHGLEYQQHNQDS